MLLKKIRIKYCSIEKSYNIYVQRSIERINDFVKGKEQRSKVFSVLIT